jgi:hypothetical protein
MTTGRINQVSIKKCHILHKQPTNWYFSSLASTRLVQNAFLPVSFFSLPRLAIHNRFMLSAYTFIILSLSTTYYRSYRLPTSRARDFPLLGLFSRHEEAGRAATPFYATSDLRGLEVAALAAPCCCS